jgi:hypothetical protein
MFTEGFSAFASRHSTVALSAHGRSWKCVQVMLLAVAAAACSGDTPFEGVTYADDVRPIFSRRCTTCHRPGGPSGVDIRDPFSTQEPPNVGIAKAMTQWKLRNPDLDIPSYDVNPGQPDDSFVIYKISDPALGLLPPDPDGPEGPEYPPAGQHMPLQVPPLTADEIALLEDWVAAGAGNGEFMDRGDRINPQLRGPQLRSFEADVRPIFGVEQELNHVNGICRPNQGVCARCVYCHYDGTPNPPNLSDPFGPDGIINVPSTTRPEFKRVVPGDPDKSLLILKVRPDTSATDYGAKMPYSFQPLSIAEVTLVRNWIADGAHP